MTFTNVFNFYIKTDFSRKETKLSFSKFLPIKKFWPPKADHRLRCHRWRAIPRGNHNRSCAVLGSVEKECLSCSGPTAECCSVETIETPNWATYQLPEMRLPVYRRKMTQSRSRRHRDRRPWWCGLRRWKTARLRRRTAIEMFGGGGGVMEWNIRKRNPEKLRSRDIERLRHQVEPTPLLVWMLW